MPDVVVLIDLKRTRPLPSVPFELSAAPQTGCAARAARARGLRRAGTQVLARGGRTPGLLEEVRPALPAALRSSDPALHSSSLKLLGGLLSDPSQCTDDDAGVAGVLMTDRLRASGLWCAGRGWSASGSSALNTRGHKSCSASAAHPLPDAAGPPHLLPAVRPGGYPPPGASPL